MTDMNNEPVSVYHLEVLLLLENICQSQNLKKSNEKAEMLRTKKLVSRSIVDKEGEQ